MTYDEIVQALRCCSYGCVCEKCPSRQDENCIDHINVSAAAAIERLVAENAKAEAERDALLEQIKARRACSDCKHFNYCEFYDAAVIDCMNCVTKNCPCHQCVNSSGWEWRGLPEAPEAHNGKENS